MELQQRLQQRLGERHSAALYRRRLVLESPQCPQLTVDGQSLLSFCSNDYLGLANHPRLIESMRSASSHYGVGSGASHLVVGHSTPHHQLEEALAAFTGRERALLFSSGYLANLGIISALLGRGDFLFEDRLNHASLLDGGLLSGARFQRFPHGDIAGLDMRLQRCGDEGARLVVVDGVFSMDGDAAPLPELAQVCRERTAWLMVDDAHGFGVLGATGAGSVEAAGLDQDDVPVLMGTLGKALGTAGAFVAGSEALIEYLVQFARSYIYTTAIPPAIAAATITALELLEEEAWRRDMLVSLIDRFCNGANELGLHLMPSDSPIQPLLVGDSARALEISARLRKRGILVTAIRPPTVPAGSARLRITLSAAHTEDQVDRLLDALAAAGI